MVNEKNCHVLSGVDLVMKEFPEGDFCVQDVVPKGLVILTGDVLEPARTLAMDMCLRVVKDEQLWRMDVRQGAVLYMIHQYTLATARNLILDMTARVPDELYVGVMTEQDLELATTGVRTFVEGYANASMVVVELAGVAEQYENDIYVPAEQLQQYLKLKTLALEHGIGVVVLLRTNSFPAVRSKKASGDLVCITDHADGHIDLCVTDPVHLRAILRVDHPARGTQLRSVVFNPKHRRWMEETEL